MKVNLNFILALLVTASSFVLTGCPSDSTDDPNPGSGPSNWQGKLIHDWSSSIREYNFSSKADPELYEGRMPNRLANGSTIYVSGVFERLQMTNAAGTQTTVLYNPQSTSAVYGPQISPDGTKIAFTHKLSSWYTSKYPVKDGTVIIDIAGNYVAGISGRYNPVWLPDGRLVVAGDFTYNYDAPSRPSENAGLYIATLNGTSATLTNINPTLSNPTPLLPSVSPDGKQVAFILNKHLWKMNLDGSNLKQVTASDNDNEESFSTWSPDGKNIAVWTYKTFETTYYTAIAIVPSDPANPVVLKNDADIWPRDNQGYRLSGGQGNISWK